MPHPRQKGKVNKIIQASNEQGRGEVAGGSPGAAFFLTYYFLLLAI
jgi:hypothetical protein